MTWSCDTCGSRRVSGSPDEGYLCRDCGRTARGDAAFGRLPSLAFDFDMGLDEVFANWAKLGSVDVDDLPGKQYAEAHHEDAPPSPPSPEPRAPSPSSSDAWSHLRCPSCFELAARCRRAGERCCVSCRCRRED